MRNPVRSPRWRTFRHRIPGKQINEDEADRTSSGRLRVMSGSVQVDTTQAHGLEVGNEVAIGGSAGTNVNGSWVVARVESPTKFYYYPDAAPTGAVATGTLFPVATRLLLLQFTESKNRVKNINLVRFGSRIGFRRNGDHPEDRESKGNAMELVLKPKIEVKS